MENTSIYEKIVKFFLLVGGIIALSYNFIYLFNIVDLEIWILTYGLTDPLLKLIGMILAVFELHVTIKPNDPIPFKLVTLLILGVALIIFSLMLSGVIIIVGAVLMEINVSREASPE